MIYFDVNPNDLDYLIKLRLTGEQGGWHKIYVNSQGLAIVLAQSLSETISENWIMGKIVYCPDFSVIEVVSKEYGLVARWTEKGKETIIPH